MIVQVQVIISGKVQGVWFRASTQEKAEELGITGWVKNTREGTVEALFEGDENKVQQLIRWCHQGPPRAQVTTVEVTKKRHVAGPAFDTFSIRF